MKELVNNIPSWMKSRYVLVGTAFLTWMLFFDNNSFVDQFQLKRQLGKLEDEKEFYQKEIVSIDETKKALFTDKSTLEKFAREEYLMKKDNEVVYVIVEE